MGMKAGSEVRFVVAHENGGIEVPWVGPATAQKFPFAAKRLKVYNIGNIGGIFGTMYKVLRVVLTCW